MLHLVSLGVGDVSPTTQVMVCSSFTNLGTELVQIDANIQYFEERISF